MQGTTAVVHDHDSRAPVDRDGKHATAPVQGTGDLATRGTPMTADTTSATAATLALVTRFENGFNARDWDAAEKLTYGTL